jgi:hypothetical protein
MSEIDDPPSQLLTDRSERVNNTSLDKDHTTGGDSPSSNHIKIEDESIRLVADEPENEKLKQMENELNFD